MNSLTPPDSRRRSRSPFIKAAALAILLAGVLATRGSSSTAPLAIAATPALVPTAIPPNDPQAQGATPSTPSVATPSVATSRQPPAQRIASSAQPLAPSLRTLSGELEALSASALQSVVAISVWRPGNNGMLFPFGPFGPPQTPQGAPRPAGQGSGVVTSADGVVVTNHHVVAGATSLSVTLADGSELDATLVGSDPATDIAVLRLDSPSDRLVPAQYADSDQVRPGALCMAIGNPFGLSGSVSLGIVSAIGRDEVGINDFEDFIQTDAAINPGNSGGALIDMEGRLIGVNSAIYSRSGGSQGIGFAIPSNMVQTVVAEILEHGRVARGWLGVRIAPAPEKVTRALNLDQPGVLIAAVDEGGPGVRAGLRGGDVVIAVDGTPVRDPDELRDTVANLGPGHIARLEVARSTGRERLEVELGERPQPATNR